MERHGCSPAPAVRPKERAAHLPSKLLLASGRGFAEQIQEIQTVEAMVEDSDARELLVGAKRDAVFGPVILFGAGGTMVEILDDNAVSLPPLNEVLAERLINRTRVSRLPVQK